MITGALVALFWAAVASIGATCALVFVRAIGPSA